MGRNAVMRMFYTKKKKIACLVLNLVVFIGSFYLLDFIFDSTKLNKDYSWSVLFAINILFDFLILGAFKVFTRKMALFVLTEITIFVLAFFFYLVHEIDGMLG